LILAMRCFTNAYGCQSEHYSYENIDAKHVLSCSKAVKIDVLIKTYKLHHYCM
jgi:hypothetical protein